MIGLALGGVACGSQDDDDSPGGTTPGSPAATTAPVTAAGDYGY